MNHAGNSSIYELARKVRASVVLAIKPKNGYFLAPTRSVDPLSKKYGFDRGMPIDRYYIEKFMLDSQDVIKGNCLEVTDTKYITMFGGGKVTHADALDINTNNKTATIYGDMRNLSNIASNTYDCLIITQTFVMIDDSESAIKECWRILKPGGYILVTMPCLSPCWNVNNHTWRWTRASGEYLFKKFFPSDILEVNTYGNVLSGQAFWVGMAAEELSQKELDHNDQFFPVTVCIKARKVV